VTGGSFQFESCLLKHYIRREAWLTACRARLARIRKLAKSEKQKRRLKYFTFCAIGALDVLLLHREKVLSRSRSGDFDTVVFFDRSNGAVVETQKRIPGATGYPTDFVNLVLQTDPSELDEFDSLDSPSDRENVRETRDAQRRIEMRRDFMRDFPFDVVNLDIERYPFIPKEELPGKLVNALRKMFDWQKRSARSQNGVEYEIDSFDLFFTAKIGPHDLSGSYMSYLMDCVQKNLDDDENLVEPFLKKSNGDDVGGFFQSNFKGAFKIAVPKSITELAFECDWYVDGKSGVDVYQFERSSSNGTYTMLHMIMKLCRQNPDQSRRGPGQRRPQPALQSHKLTVEKIFEDEAVEVELKVSGAAEGDIKNDLDELILHRELIYSEET
jgi:hypothetical protein